MSETKRAEVNSRGSGLRDEGGEKSLPTKKERWTMGACLWEERRAKSEDREIERERGE